VRLSAGRQRLLEDGAAGRGNRPSRREVEALPLHGDGGAGSVGEALAGGWRGPVGLMPVLVVLTVGGGGRRPATGHAPPGHRRRDDAEPERAGEEKGEKRPARV
jgi:hypothetical protein